MEPTRTIIVVDDELGIRESLGEALQDQGYAVVLASNGREALLLLPTLSRPLVVILDIVMPVMNGRELYSAMQADPELADLPVVFSTSDASRVPAGGRLIKKPINLDRLLTTLSALF